MSVQPLAQIDASAFPREVREGSAEDKRLYRAALGFERVLVGELTKAMQGALEGGAEEKPAGGPYADLIPQAMADALTERGGLGIAPQLYEALRQGGAEA